MIGGTIVALTFVPIRRWGERWVDEFVERQMPTHLLATGDTREGAVAVVDISGFTALSARDEQSALLATALVQKQARKVVNAYAGRVVKTTGDGALMVFDHAADAAAAVRELHASFGRDALLLGLPPHQLHSGLGWGEYVDVRDADIYGHTVNVASRVADSAAAGEILVTSAFAEALGQCDPLPVEVGARRFKNVPEPVVCLRL